MHTAVDKSNTFKTETRTDTRKYKHASGKASGGQNKGDTLYKSCHGKLKIIQKITEERKEEIKPRRRSPSAIVLFMCVYFFSISQIANRLENDENNTEASECRRPP